MTDSHDPIQRFSAYHSGDPHKVGLWADGDGHWVTYVDHVAAVAAVRAERQAEFTRMENAWRDECDRRERAAWDLGDRNVAEAYAAAVDEAIRRVEGLPLDIAEWLVSADVRGVVLAALADMKEA